MKQPMSGALALVLAVAAVALPSAATRHKPKATAAAPPSFTSDYPDAAIGVLMEGPGWTEISGVGPSPSNEGVRHGLAAALSSGAIPAASVARFHDAHAALQVRAGQEFLHFPVHGL